MFYETFLCFAQSDDLAWKYEEEFMFYEIAEEVRQEDVQEES